MSLTMNQEMLDAMVARVKSRFEIQGAFNLKNGRLTLLYDQLTRMVNAGEESENVVRLYNKVIEELDRLQRHDALSYRFDPNGVMLGVIPCEVDGSVKR